MKKRQVILDVILVPAIAIIALACQQNNAGDKVTQGSTQIATKVQPSTSAGRQRASISTQGGSQLTIKLKPTSEHPVITPQDVDAVRKILENRINGLGVSDAVIQSAGNDRVVVQLPGIKDPRQAERVLGGTAQLEFREQKADTEGQLGAEMAVLKEAKDKQAAFKKNKSADTQAIATNNAAIEKQKVEISKLFHKAVITGQHIAGANPQPLPGGGWEVAIEFNSTGSGAFAKLTKNLAGTGRSIGVFLDKEPISTPTVGPTFADTGITGGKAVIMGNFTTETANDLAVQLRGGAMPLPIEIIENRLIQPKFN
jgi:preprotein translocase subunit SecD